MLKRNVKREKLLIVTIISTIGFVHSNVTKTCKPSTKHRILESKYLFHNIYKIITYISFIKPNSIFSDIKRDLIYEISFSLIEFYDSVSIVL